MSFRGRGRGRFGGGRGGFGFGFARQEPYVEFPEVELPDRKAMKEEMELVRGNTRLSKTKLKRDALDAFLQVGASNFPKELTTGAKWERPNPKQVRWDPISDLQKWDLFEKIEQKREGREEKGEKENKEGEDEEEDEDVEAEEAEEDFSDDDYGQNIDFDDDDDDYNDMDDGGKDEAEY